MTNESTKEMGAAKWKWITTHGEGMTGRELELARALYETSDDSRTVRQINEVLRARLLARINER